ncbi:hypothetical protein [Saccharothrix sp. ST-888]|uniref:hypothetical protein n=1 Tax=Saccharothrix sp. ST-888 TaxID=1427391 RepID=UPI0005EC3450|nr:hypothetical protein [Saccharothrix sp. ST-888]KJK56237.1 hypothetical protein UK12_23940 [Saccharothrix sp. ST-888]
MSDLQEALAHLGAAQRLSASFGQSYDEAQRELEGESDAYVIFERLGTDFLRLLQVHKKGQRSADAVSVLGCTDAQLQVLRSIRAAETAIYMEAAACIAPLAVAVALGRLAKERELTQRHPGE